MRLFAEKMGATTDYVPAANGSLPHVGMTIRIPWKASYPAGEYGVELFPAPFTYEDNGVIKTGEAGAGVFTNLRFPFTIR